MSQRRRVVAAVLMSTASLLVAANVAQAAPAPPTPPADDKADPRLIALRADLMSKDRPTVLADVKAFRPLCDAQGYPLVGNLATKGMMFQPSEFCAHIRTTEKHDSSSRASASRSSRAK